MIRYVTRWALSSGIRALDLEPADDTAPADQQRRWWSPKLHMGFSRSETFETEDAAQVQARHMAQRRIVSLRKQIAKLDGPDWKAKVRKP